MQWGLETSEKLNVPIYLESTVEGVPLYNKLGFRTLAEPIVFKPEVTGREKDIQAPLMVKMPKSAGDTTFEQWAESEPSTA
jgi:hypothetical protein